MQDTFARTRTRPKLYAAAKPSARASIGYLVYNSESISFSFSSNPNTIRLRELYFSFTTCYTSIVMMFVTLFPLCLGEDVLNILTPYKRTTIFARRLAACKAFLLVYKIPIVARLAECAKVPCILHFCTYKKATATQTGKVYGLAGETFRFPIPDREHYSRAWTEHFLGRVYR